MNVASRVVSGLAEKEVGCYLPVLRSALLPRLKLVCGSFHPAFLLILFILKYDAMSELMMGTFTRRSGGML